MQREKLLRHIELDLDMSGAPERGLVWLDNGVIHASIGGREVFSHDLSDAAELKLNIDIGCASLEIVRKDPENAQKPLPDSENITVCRFTMSALVEMGELCKAANHWINEREQPVNEIKTERRRCEKCGRPFPRGINVCLFCVKKGYIARRSAQLLKPYAKPIFISSLILVLANILFALRPLLYSFALDNYLAPAGGVITAQSPARGMLIIAALMIAVRAIGQVFSIFSSRMANRAGARFSDGLRRLVYDKIQYLSLSSMSGKTSGDLMKRITSDTETVRGFLANQGRYAIQQLLMFVVVFVILMLTNPFLTLLVFIPVPVVFYCFRRFWQFIRVRYGKQWRRESRANSILHDIIKGIRVVKTFGNEEREIGKFGAACRKVAEISASNERTWAITFPPLSFLMGIGEFLVLFFGGRMVLSGTMSLGGLVQFTLFLGYIYAPLQWLTSLPRWLANATTSMVKILEIIDEPPEIIDVPSPRYPDIRGGITFKNVSFGYKSYEPVLKNINLTIRPGEMVGLVGHSGAGKSTMINLIMRLYDPNDGSVLLDGEDLRDIPQKYLHDNIGVVFQETFLFAGSVYDNIAYAKPDATREEVVAAAKAANAHGFIMNLPDAYDTVIGENGHNLSGGERQRLAIARAVLKNPKILILDEATSSLDPETESKIQEALVRLVKNRTTIAIAHRLSTLRNADRLVVLEKGEIAETGSHRELLEQKGIYYRLVLAQRHTARLTKEARKALEAPAK